MLVSETAESHGWKLLCHPAFLAPYVRLLEEVENLQTHRKRDFEHHPKVKLFARIYRLIFEEIPSNPKSPEYEQGNTLGKDFRHWRRAKFLERFRLFFRFSSAHRVIIYAWVNDETTLRKAGSKTDPYATFARRLMSGDPPDSWDQLMEVAEPVPKTRRATRPKSAQIQTPRKRPGKSKG